mmetsp:Transcript_10640/g.19190  ORF Transcript_10640/g.19190 Transcript_10640/m.19190 type:complete len:884 (-) Transcript_10640:467-3118(-)
MLALEVLEIFRRIVDDEDSLLLTCDVLCPGLKSLYSTVERRMVSEKSDLGHIPIVVCLFELTTDLAANELAQTQMGSLVDACVRVIMDEAYKIPSNLGEEWVLLSYELERAASSALFNLVDNNPSNVEIFGNTVRDTLSADSRTGGLRERLAAICDRPALLAVLSSFRCVFTRLWKEPPPTLIKFRELLSSQLGSKNISILKALSFKSFNGYRSLADKILEGTQRLSVSLSCRIRFSDGSGEKAVWIDMTEHFVSFSVVHGKGKSIEMIVNHFPLKSISIVNDPLQNTIKLKVRGDPGHGSRNDIPPIFMSSFDVIFESAHVTQTFADSLKIGKQRPALSDPGGEGNEKCEALKTQLTPVECRKSSLAQMFVAAPGKDSPPNLSEKHMQQFTSGNSSLPNGEKRISGSEKGALKFNLPKLTETRKVSIACAFTPAPKVASPVAQEKIEICSSSDSEPSKAPNALQDKVPRSETARNPTAVSRSRESDRCDNDSVIASDVTDLENNADRNQTKAHFPETRDAVDLAGRGSRQTGISVRSKGKDRIAQLRSRIKKRVKPRSSVHERARSGADKKKRKHLQSKAEFEQSSSEDSAWKCFPTSSLELPKVNASPIPLDSVPNSRRRLTRSTVRSPLHQTVSENNSLTGSTNSRTVLDAEPNPDITNRPSQKKRKVKVESPSVVEELSEAEGSLVTGSQKKNGNDFVSSLRNMMSEASGVSESTVLLQNMCKMLIAKKSALAKKLELRKCQHRKNIASLYKSGVRQVEASVANYEKQWLEANQQVAAEVEAQSIQLKKNQELCVTEIQKSVRSFAKFTPVSGFENECNIAAIEKKWMQAEKRQLDEIKRHGLESLRAMKTPKKGSVPDGVIESVMQMTGNLLRELETV